MLSLKKVACTAPLKMGFQVAQEDIRLDTIFLFSRLSVPFLSNPNAHLRGKRPAGA